MSEYSELIKNFDKIRDYMRDFYVYGFKIRGEYTYKSARTYDNERRRIESWLAPFVRWEQSAKGKRVFLSVDSSHIASNPLYAAWKSKSFTRRDILLHFFTLCCLADGEGRTAGELAGLLSLRFGADFDAQTIRAKLREYESLGILTACPDKKSLRYALSDSRLSALACFEPLMEAVRFFQEAAPFGFIGSTILDAQEAVNDRFLFKHHFIVHTLEDGVLQDLLAAMRQNRRVLVENRSRRTGRTTAVLGVPLRIFSSLQSGRRYVCVYLPASRRFACIRLDSVTRVETGEKEPMFDLYRQNLSRNLFNCWGVSFGGRERTEQIFLRLRIDEERERFVLDRLRREGRGGEILRLGTNAFLYSRTVFDSNEMLPWIKTFIGRIESFEGTNPAVVRRFYSDMRRMRDMYCARHEGETAADGTV